MLHRAIVPPMQTTSIQTRCDLCGHGGAYTRPQDFSRAGGFDLCRWCMSGPVQKTECGGHIVTVTGDTWACDCGMTMAMLKHVLWSHGVDFDVMAAVPNLPSATAAIHVQTPNWPKSY